MWEYQVKQKRPIDPRESADIHPAARANQKAAGDRVHAHPDSDAGQSGSAHTTANKKPDQPRSKRQLQCPACQQSMQREFIGRVEIDRCPACGGIFLDRGELELLSHSNPSSYQPAGSDNSGEFIVYTPHGLSNHVRDVGQD